MKVLIVDDDPNLRTIFSRALGEAGFETRTAHDAAGGIAALSDGLGEVLLLDLKLGRDHGLDVAREVDRLQLPMRIVIVSGTGDFTRDELFAMSPSIKAVLRKPVDIETLVAEVQRAASA